MRKEKMSSIFGKQYLTFSPVKFFNQFLFWKQLCNSHSSLEKFRINPQNDYWKSNPLKDSKFGTLRFCFRFDTFLQFDFDFWSSFFFCINELFQGKPGLWLHLVFEVVLYLAASRSRDQENQKPYLGNWYVILISHRHHGGHVFLVSLVFGNNVLELNLQFVLVWKWLQKIVLLDIFSHFWTKCVVLAQCALSFPLECVFAKLCIIMQSKWWFPDSLAKEVHRLVLSAELKGTCPKMVNTLEKWFLCMYIVEWVTYKKH